jgi:hypothetical protein
LQTPEPILCQPEEYSGEDIPIGEMYANDDGVYKQFVNVGDLNSENDEWHLSELIEGEPVILTASDPDNYMGMKKYRMKDRAQFKYVSDLNENKRYHTGLPFFINGKYYISTAIKKDAIDYWGGNVGIDTMQGLSYLIEAGKSISDFESSLVSDFDSKVMSGRKQRLFIDNRLDYWVSQFTNGPNDNIILFASDIEGGYGGTDIYYANIVEGRIGEPINLGPEVNTPCNELSPYFDKHTGKFLFASQGHKSVGGFDLFRSDIEYTENSIAISGVTNLGRPINSPSDEILPSTTKDKRHILYFSSNREGGYGGFDIYAFYKQSRNESLVADTYDRANLGDVKQKRTAAAELKKIEIKDNIDKYPVLDTVNLSANEALPPDSVSIQLGGKVIDETGNPVISATVTASSKNTGQKLEGTITDSDGDFELDIETDCDIVVTAQSDKEFYQTQDIKIADLKSGDIIELDFTLPSSLNIRINFPNDIADNPYEFVLDSMGRMTSTKWETSMDMLADHIKKYRSTIDKVRIIGHTSQKGTAAYNKQLGLKRAGFVAEQLIIRGISKKLLKIISLGETEPLDRYNGEPQDQYDSRLRRVEIIKDRK